VNGEQGWHDGRLVRFAAILTLLFTVHCLLFTLSLQGQQPDTVSKPLLPGQDTTRAVTDTTTRPDTTGALFDSTGHRPLTAADSARLDSLKARRDSSPAQRYLALERLREVKVPVLPPLDVTGPAPALSRLVFTRDSMDWGHAATLSDLLQRVPGVFVWRGGWLGQPEYPNFEGAGATSVEYWLDGVPYIAAGTDSVGVDPSIFALSLLDRVEIERWPGLLRVRMYTRNLDRLAPRSRIAVSRGQESFARYQASLERRTRSGLGYVIAGDNVSVPTIQGFRSKYGNTSFFVQGSYVPSPRWGVLLQALRSRPRRDPTLDASADTLTRGLFAGRRMDWQLRGMWRADTGEFGARADLVLARTTASDSLTPSQTINSVGLAASLRRPTYSASASAFYRSRWTSADLRLNGAWSPLGGAALSAEAAYQRHDGGRTSNWVGLRAGVRLPLGLDGTASLRAGNIVSAPALLTDTAQSVRDWQLSIAWRRRWAELEGGLAHTAAFVPQAFQPYAAIPVLAPSAGTDWLTARARLTPLPWISLEGWVSDPRHATPDGLPPRHFLGSGTIRTKFLRLFPSGTLDVELRIAVEHWSAGTSGRDAFGDPVTLPAATYLRSLIQVALGSFQFFWDRSNLTETANPYVPGLPVPGRPSEFGVRWTFAN
jgi:hypothetical protein